MLILCEGLYHEDVLYLKEIKSNILVDDVNIQYNFIILPVNNQEKTTLIKNNYYYDYPTNIIYQIFPNILNFTSNDSLEIDLYLEKPRDVNGITFNEYAEDLKCINLIQIKRCKVPKEHFKGKNDGYYYIKYDNNLDFNSKTTS